MPYFGKHPGIPLVIYLISVTGIGGMMTNGVLNGFICGWIIGSIVYIPMLLWGSYTRSRELDRYIERRHQLIEDILTT